MLIQGVEYNAVGDSLLYAEYDDPANAPPADTTDDQTLFVTILKFGHIGYNKSAMVGEVLKLNSATNLTLDHFESMFQEVKEFALAARALNPNDFANETDYGLAIKSLNARLTNGMVSQYVSDLKVHRGLASDAPFADLQATFPAE